MTSTQTIHAELTTLEPKNRLSSASASKFLGSTDRRFLMVSHLPLAVLWGCTNLNATKPFDSAVAGLAVGVLLSPLAEPYL